MDNIGGHVNPLHLVGQLPAGMEIPGLRDRLVRATLLQHVLRPPCLPCLDPPAAAERELLAQLNSCVASEQCCTVANTMLLAATDIGVLWQRSHPPRNRSRWRVV